MATLEDFLRGAVSEEELAFVVQSVTEVINDAIEDPGSLWSSTKIAAAISGSAAYNRRPKVIDIVDSTSVPPTEVLGDRYILDNSGAPNAAWDGAAQGDIVEFDGASWIADAPQEGWVSYLDAQNKDALFVDDGTPAWEVREVAVTDHVNLASIGVNTHAQIDTHIADTVNPHATDIANLGTGTLAELNTAITDATLIDTADARLSDSRTPTAHGLGGAEHSADTLANLNLKVSDATLIDTADARLSDDRTPTAHGLGGAEHNADTLANLNLKVSDATLIDTADARLSDARTPTSHAFAGAEHSVSTLAAVNSKVSDATLIDTTDARLSDSRAPNGAAGGDLAGTYPNPTIAALAVGTPELAASAVTAAKAAIFVSTEQTGTGASQNVAHGLGAAPSAVLISITDDNAAAFTIVEGAHDGTNVVVTVTTSAKFKVLAWA